MERWFYRAMSVRERKVVTKLWDEDGAFLDAIHIPSQKYPLSNNDFQIFHCDNTQAVEDETVLRIFDQQEYRIGKCYSNTRHLVDALQKAGYNALPYCGWLFVGENEYPVHHCWTVLDGKYILDLCDDQAAMLGGENGKYFEQAQTKEDFVELMTSFHLAARSWRHRDRCYPVGIPFPQLFYIGVECDPDVGKNLFRNLLSQYPRHECYRTAPGTDCSPIQAYMAKHGVV